MAVDADPALTKRRPAFPAATVTAWLMLAGLFALSVFLRHILPANTDVSWLLTVGERVLDGQRLYIDVIETNPPMAVWIYLPAIELAHTFGWQPERVTDALVFLSILASLAVTARILNSSSIPENLPGWPLAWLAFVVLAVLPTKIFGQREQIAVIELLPAMALYAVRVKGASPKLWAILVAGAGAGLAMTFKPYFALGIFCGLAALAIHARSWRIVFGPENFLAAVIVAIYGACVWVFYPAFFSDIAPLVRDIYIMVGASFVDMIKTPAPAIWLLLIFAAMVLKGRSRIDGPLLLLLATSFGFMIAFFLQRKGWPYHSYPMIAFAMLGTVYAFAARKPLDRAFGLFGGMVLVIAFAQSVVWFNWAFDKAFDARPLWDAVARLGPHPKILAITGEPGLGHPLTRALGGTWVSRQQGLWISSYLQEMGNVGERKTVLEGYAARERAMLLEDIARHPPTVVLVDNFSGHWGEWLKENPAIDSALVDYRTVATIHDIEIRAKAP